jgi:NAD(P)-dependent dehydrogenase (short-subunit alcohol dehydrogenase family)
MQQTRRKDKTTKTIEGKVAVITGGGSGIGVATATPCEELGAQIAISGHQ